MIFTDTLPDTLEYANGNSINETTPENRNYANDTNETVHVNVTDVAVTKVLNDTEAVAGTNLTYKIVVTSNGPDAAHDVYVVDEFVSETKLTGLQYYMEGKGDWTNYTSEGISLGTVNKDVVIIITLEAILMRASKAALS